MWKTLGGFWAQTSPISYILAEKTAHIHCAAVDVAFLRRPYLVICMVRAEPLVFGPSFIFSTIEP
ncbi:protein of unknown function [Cyanobium sp. NIES-981]|nr:protein of unknown function [Cyanobium sp. NIES-981]